MRLVGMTERNAAEISTWSYEPPFTRFGLTGIDPAFLLDPANGYLALVDGAELIGYRCFGAGARVAGGAYDASALDTGGGLRPDLTGKGLGRPALSVGLRCGRRLHRPVAFRVTVAAGNVAALRVVRSAGFADQGVFRSPDDVRNVVLLRPERPWSRREPSAAGTSSGRVSG